MVWDVLAAHNPHIYLRSSYYDPSIYVRDGIRYRSIYARGSNYDRCIFFLEVTRNPHAGESAAGVGRV